MMGRRNCVLGNEARQTLPRVAFTKLTAAFIDGQQQPTGRVTTYDYRLPLLSHGAPTNVWHAVILPRHKPGAAASTAGRIAAGISSISLKSPDLYLDVLRSRALL